MSIRIHTAFVNHPQIEDTTPYIDILRGLMKHTHLLLETLETEMRLILTTIRMAFIYSMCFEPPTQPEYGLALSTSPAASYLWAKRGLYSGDDHRLHTVHSVCLVPTSASTE